jgi:hypothetical protein
MASARDAWELSWRDEDGVVAVLSVYMDESGTHDGSPVVAVGAYVATPKQCAVGFPPARNGRRATHASAAAFSLPERPVSVLGTRAAGGSALRIWPDRVATAVARGG